MGIELIADKSPFFYIGVRLNRLADMCQEIFFGTRRLNGRTNNSSVDNIPVGCQTLSSVPGVFKLLTPFFSLLQGQIRCNSLQGLNARFLIYAQGFYSGIRPLLGSCQISLTDSGATLCQFFGRALGIEPTSGFMGFDFAFLLKKAEPGSS